MAQAKLDLPVQGAFENVSKSKRHLVNLGKALYLLHETGTHDDK